MESPPSQLHFALALGRFESLRAQLRVRQRVAVELAVGQLRQAFHDDDVRRHHVFRQRGFQLLLEAVFGQAVAVNVAAYITE
jgi:hypothetical protein